MFSLAHCAHCSHSAHGERPIDRPLPMRATATVPATLGWRAREDGEEEEQQFQVIDVDTFLSRAERAHSFFSLASKPAGKPALSALSQWFASRAIGQPIDCAGQSHVSPLAVEAASASALRQQVAALFPGACALRPATQGKVLGPATSLPLSTRRAYLPFFRRCGFACFLLQRDKGLI